MTDINAVDSVGLLQEVESRIPAMGVDDFIRSVFHAADRVKMMAWLKLENKDGTYSRPEPTWDDLSTGEKDSAAARGFPDIYFNSIATALEKRLEIADFTGGTFPSFLRKWIADISGRLDSPLYEPELGDCVMYHGIDGADYYAYVTSTSAAGEAGLLVLFDGYGMPGGHVACCPVGTDGGQFSPCAT